MPVTRTGRGGHAPCSNSRGGVMEFRTSTFNAALHATEKPPCQSPLRVRAGCALRQEKRMIAAAAINTPRLLPIILLRACPPSRQPLPRRVLLQAHETLIRSCRVSRRAGAPGVTCDTGTGGVGGGAVGLWPVAKTDSVAVRAGGSRLAPLFCSTAAGARSEPTLRPTARRPVSLASRGTGRPRSSKA